MRWFEPRHVDACRQHNLLNRVASGSYNWSEKFCGSNTKTATHTPRVYLNTQVCRSCRTQATAPLNLGNLRSHCLPFQGPARSSMSISQRKGASSFLQLLRQRAPDTLPLGLNSGQMYLSHRILNETILMTTLMTILRMHFFNFHCQISPQQSPVTVPLQVPGRSLILAPLRRRFDVRLSYHLL